MKKLLENISIISLCLGLLFFVNNNLLPKSLYFFTFSAISMLFLLLSNKKIKIYKKAIPLIIFLLYLLLELVFNYLSESLNYIIYYVYGIIFLIYFLNNQNSIKKVIDIYYIGSILFCFITIFSYFFQNIYLQVIKLLYYGTNSYDTVINLYNWHEYSGIAGQTGYNAFVISIGIIISFVNLLSNYTENNKFDTKKVLLFLLQVGSLFLCSKRAVLLYIVITLLLIIPVYMSLKKKKNINKITFWLISISLIGVLCINFIEPLRNVFLKNSYYISKGNILNGREKLYSEAIKIFLAHPIFGIGINNYHLYNGLDLDAHNVYLQILAENGIVGFLILVPGFIYILVQTILLYRKNRTCKYIPISIAIQIFFLLYSLTGNAFYDMNMLYLYLCVVSINSSITVVKK